jgi:hypothetical protein
MRPTPKASGRDLWKGTRACLGGGVHTWKARSECLKGERASEGRRCSERGTLNATRKAKGNGAGLCDGFLLTRPELRMSCGGEPVWPDVALRCVAMPASRASILLALGP